MARIVLDSARLVHIHICTKSGCSKTPRSSFSHSSFPIILLCSALFLCSIEPRFITPVHDYSKRPLQLFWIDGLALKAIAADMYTPDDLASNNETAMVVQVIEDDGDNRSSDGSNEGPLLYPLQPPVSTVGNFKTTPATHIGYAATWFGLSGAGLYMTRKLITKGRF